VRTSRLHRNNESGPHFPKGSAPNQGARRFLAPEFRGVVRQGMPMPRHRSHPSRVDWSIAFRARCSQALAFSRYSGASQASTLSRLPGGFLIERTESFLNQGAKRTASSCASMIASVHQRGAAGKQLRRPGCSELRIIGPATASEERRVPDPSMRAPQRRRAK